MDQVMQDKDLQMRPFEYWIMDDGKNVEKIRHAE